MSSVHNHGGIRKGISFVPGRLSEQERHKRRVERMGGDEAYRQYIRDCQKKNRVENRAAFLLKSARRSAKSKNREFNLTVNDLGKLPTHCPVLGIELDYTCIVATDVSPSLDRINNEEGYIPGNIIVVSWRANRIKSNATIAELQRVADFYGSLENG